MKCASCSTNNREGRKFCGACGASLAQACPSCNFVNESGDHFCGGCGSALTEVSELELAAPEQKESDDQILPNQRRQVTIIFADISSFTKISQQLDPEELHAMLQSFFDTADGIIESYGGTIDKHIGDAVMGLFGAPIAHSDDPQRAVRAAIDLHAAVDKMAELGGYAFKVHIGIAAGEVVAGGVGGGKRKDYTVVGDSVNLAARLQEHASSRETLVSDIVQGIVADTVSCERITLLDKDHPESEFSAWRVLGMASGPARRPGTPIIGRTSELQQFEALADAANALGRGEVILVRGEAGIGKTRLIDEYVSIAQTKGFSHHGAQVLDFGAGEGQDATSVLVRSLVGLSTDAPAEVRVKVVASAVANSLIDADLEVFLRDLVGLDPPEQARASLEAMDYTTRLDGKKAVLTGLLTSISAQTPLMICVEDLHWAQSITLEYMAHICESIRHSTIVLVMCTRNEGDPTTTNWRNSLRGVSLVELNLTPLSRSDAKVYAAQFADRSGQYIADCIDRADGNPLFLEQLLRDAEDGRQSALPASIQSLVLSRMDRLKQKDRRALQAASVIGQRFELDVLCHLLGQSRFDCMRLLDNQLIKLDGTGYSFTHSLIRDGAYASLLRSSAHELHRSAAAFYKDRDVLLQAEHLDKASDPSAPDAYLAAAQQKREAFRFGQAQLLVERALELVENPITAFELYCLHGELLLALGTTEASSEAYDNALNIARTEPERCRALIGMVEGMRDGQQFDMALELLERAQDIATRLGLTRYLAQIHGQRGNLYFPRGKVEACLEEQKLSLANAKQSSSPELEANALSGLGDAEYARGRMQTAHRHFADCVDLCRHHGFTRIKTPNLALRGLTNFYCAQPQLCIDDCDMAISAAIDTHQQRAELVARTAAAPAYFEMLDVDGADDQCRRAMEIVDKLKARRFLPECLSFLAKIEMLNGNRNAAVELATRAVEISLESDAGRAFTGPWALSTLAVVTDDPLVRADALSRGPKIIAKGCVSHNYLWFHRDGIEATLRAGEWDSALAHADALEKFLISEPLDWPSIYIDLARCLEPAGKTRWTDAANERLSGVKTRASRAGLTLAARLAEQLETET